MIKYWLFAFFCLFSSSSFACGTPANWMDAYEDIATGNKWRDTMNPLESLVMLMGCEGDNPSRLSVEEQQRMTGILSDALFRSDVLINMYAIHYEIKDKVRRFRNPVGIYTLVESIYRRYQCLPDVTDKIFLEKNFGNRSCPGGDVVLMKINAQSGGRLRAVPDGRVVTTLAHNTVVEVLSEKGGWHKVINPISMGGSETMVGFIHKSILTRTEIAQ